VQKGLRSLALQKRKWSPFLLGLAGWMHPRLTCPAKAIKELFETCSQPNNFSPGLGCIYTTTKQKAYASVEPGHREPVWVGRSIGKKTNHAHNAFLSLRDLCS
jgi:hypothetical protein